MTIIVTGAGGMLGKAVVEAARANSGHVVVPYTRQQLDITNDGHMDTALAFVPPPFTIINCAGIVRGRHDFVSLAEAHLVNTEAVHNLARLCTRLVQVSTDCVFDGALGPSGAIPTYNELSPTCPTDWYGLTKAAGEVLSAPHVTVRGSFIGFEHGLLAWFLAQPEEATVTGYTDHIWTGTYVADYAAALVKIAVDPGATGVIHLVAARTTKAILLRELGELLRPDIHVDPQRAPDGPRHLDLRSTRIDVPALPEWHISLRRLARDYAKR